MKIKDGGKEHIKDDPYCAACDAPEGEPHPQICGVNHCNGLRHAEEFGDLNRGGTEVLYLCDKCGERG
jgi:hypothetical protein